MPKPTKRWLRILYERQQRLGREKNPKMLVRWLNQNGGSAPYRRLVRIIELFSELRELTPPLPILEFIRRETSERPASNFPWEKMRRLNVLLARYETWAQCTARKTRLGLSGVDRL